MEQIRPPHIVPTSRGGVSLEWHRPGLEFSIEVEPTAESKAAAWAFFADDDAGDYWHALPDGWHEMPYGEFLEARCKLMARVIRDGFARLGSGG